MAYVATHRQPLEFCEGSEAYELLVVDESLTDLQPRFGGLFNACSLLTKFARNLNHVSEIDNI